MFYATTDNANYVEIKKKLKSLAPREFKCPPKLKDILY